MLTRSDAAWKVHFEGWGKGVYRASPLAAAEGSDLNAVANALVRQNREGPRGVTPEVCKRPVMVDGAEEEKPAPVTNGAAKTPAPEPEPATNGAVKQPENSTDGAVQPPEEVPSKPANTDGSWSFDGVPPDAAKAPAAPTVDGKGKPLPPICVPLNFNTRLFRHDRQSSGGR